MKFYGELLVIVLLLAANGRILFIKNAKKDSFVMLSPLAFLLSIIQIFNWGADTITCLTFVLSVLVLLSNFHALFRYSERLYIDHYSILMKVWSGITIILSLVLIAGTIYFRPVDYSNKELGIQETVMRYEGSFRSGFEEASNIRPASVFLTEFKSLDSENARTKDIVIFIPDKRGDTYYYKPYLQHLAKEGFVVLSADFFCSDCKWRHSISDYKVLRRFAMVIDSFVNEQSFAMQKEFYTYNIMQEIKALGDFAAELYGPETRLFIITDVMGTVAAQDYRERNAEKVLGIFDLQSIPEYKTPGYGTVSQTDVLLAMYLGQTRDKDGFYTKYMVMQTRKEIFKAREAAAGGSL